MSGAKETPRQKMIGMMYLVYTALLAMNVSADILDAFAIVNDGQEKTNASIEIKINDQYTALEEQYIKEQDKTQLYWDKALEIREKTDDIVNYIEKDVKLPLLLTTEKIGSEEELLNPKDPSKSLIRNKEKADPKNRRVFYELELKNVGAKDNYDVPTTLMIEGGKATELKQKIQEYREFIVRTVEEAGIRDYNNHVGLLTDVDQDGNKIIYRNADNQEISWEIKNFSHIVFVAEMAILNKLVGEIQTTEYDAVSALMGRIGATDYKFNKLQARVIAKSDYITQGQDYEAEVFLVASDTMRSFDIKYGFGVDDFSKYKGTPQTAYSEKGIVKLRIPGRSIGEQRYAGVVEMTNPETGEMEYHPFSTSYMVAEPSATIAPTKMMVMYSGLENPISVSAPGYRPGDIRVVVTGGQIVRSDRERGEYLIKPTSVKEDVHVIASAMKDGKPFTLRDELFRVKPLPTPQASIGGVVGSGKLSKGRLISAGKVVARMDDFDFGDYSYEIVSYNVNTIVRGNYQDLGKTNSDMLNDRVKNEINRSTRGQKFNFSNIVAKAPDGSFRTLGNIEIEIE